MKKRIEIEEDKGNSGQERRLAGVFISPRQARRVRREMLSKMKEDSVEPRAKVEGSVECELCGGVVDGTCEQSLSSRY